MKKLSSGLEKMREYQAEINRIFALAITPPEGVAAPFWPKESSESDDEAEKQS